MEKQATIDAEIESEELRSLKQQVVTLSQKLEQLQTDMAQQSKALAELTAKLGSAGASVKDAPAKADTAKAAHEPAISPEMLVIIAAAVSTFLGKKIRIRSARMLQSPYEIINPWSQQGRVSVQASHTLRWER